MKEFFLKGLLIFVLILSSLNLKCNDRKGKDIALFFPISNYDNFSKLKNRVTNAYRMGKLLENKYNFEVEVFLDATKNEIVKKLEEYLSRNYYEDSQLFIFFSGHGILDNFGTGYFVPKDGTINSGSNISYADLKDKINGLPSNHILLMLDACYSGKINSTQSYISKNIFGSPNIGLYPFISNNSLFKNRPGETNIHKLNMIINNGLRNNSRLILQFRTI